MSEYVIENFILVDTVGSNVLTYTIEELGNGTDYRWVNTCMYMYMYMYNDTELIHVHVHVQ